MEQVQAVIPAVINQHADEAAFLWLLRDAAVSSPHFSLADLAKLDGRVEAHLDGLRIAGAEGRRVCAESLKLEETGEVFAAAVLAFEAGDQPRIQQILNIVAEGPALAAGLISALGWVSFSQAESHARTLLAVESAVLRRVGLAAFTVHRQYPGEALRLAVHDTAPALQALALKAVGELGRLDLVPGAATSLSSENADVRFCAAWSVALLNGSASALSALQSMAEGPGPRQAQILQLAMRRSPPFDAKAWQRKLAQRSEHLRLAIIAACHMGDPEAIPWLIQQMKPLPLARLAGEAFTMITGVDLAFRDLERKPPEDFIAGPTEDPKDENVEMDPDDNLPWPEPSLIQKWWDKNRSQFQNGTRYLLGKPLTADWLKTVLRDGRQRQRSAAALELAIRTPGLPLFNVKAPGFRQIALLGKPGPAIR
jgi:uncharacterized protein (TIGR02270 family)